MRKLVASESAAEGWSAMFADFEDVSKEELRGALNHLRSEADCRRVQEQVTQQQLVGAFARIAALERRVKALDGREVVGNGRSGVLREDGNAILLPDGSIKPTEKARRFLEGW
jgi:hypothetical protein